MMVLQEGEAGSMVVPCGERLLIQRGLEDKSTEVMKSLMRSGGAYTSPALSSLLGGGSGGNKDEIGEYRLYSTCTRERLCVCVQALVWGSV